MKRIILIAALATFSAAALADTYVNGYTRSDGTYVQGHYRSEANSNRYDNYSSQGNTNPYTGQRGYESNEYSTTSTTSNTGLYQGGSDTSLSGRKNR